MAAQPLALLGDVIANAGAQYAANAQQRQQREQQLADIAAARAFQQQQIEEQRAYQDYVRDIERLAAERATGEHRDYSDYVRAQERAAAREDIASARAFERETRQEGWKHEENLYTNRRHDAIKTQLMLDGHLKPGDLDNPEAFAAALAAGGPQYKRDLQELAEYKAAIPEILKSTRGEPGIASRISEILDLKPANIGRARELMKDAYGMIAKTVDTEKDQKELNAKNGALLMMAHLGKLAEIDNQKATLISEMDRIAGNNFTPKELGEIHAKALANLIPDYQKAFARGAPSDKAKAALAAEESKAAEEVKLIAQSNLGTRAKSLDNQMGRVASQYEGVKAAIQAGTAGYMDPKQTGWAFNTGPSREAPASREKVVSRADAQKEADAFTAGLGGPAPAGPAAAPASTVTQPLPPTTGDVVPVPKIGAPPIVPPPALNVTPPSPWTPPEANPVSNLIERNPATGGMLRSAADVQRARNSDILGTNISGLVGAADAPPVDMATGQLASAGQKFLGFGLNRTPTSSLYDRIRSLAEDPRSPHRIQLVKDAMILARARGEEVPEDIAQEFGMAAGAAPPIVGTAPMAPVPIPALDQLPAARTAVPVSRSPVPEVAFDTTGLSPFRPMSAQIFSSPGPMVEASLQQREAEDRILTRAPYSLQAIEIRRKRNIPSPGGSPGSLMNPTPMAFGM